MRTFLPVLPVWLSKCLLFVFVNSQGMTDADYEAGLEPRSRVVMVGQLNASELPHRITVYLPLERHTKLQLPLKAAVFFVQTYFLASCFLSVLVRLSSLVKGLHA
jgi:hypothetical protein